MVWHETDDSPLSETKFTYAYMRRSALSGFVAMVCGLAESKEKKEKLRWTEDNQWNPIHSLIEQ